ncbi:MAG: hypothetical protein Q9190_002841 [Brigantiaea leucoxantha]
MVQLEEVEDADLKREQPGPFDEASFVEDDADFTDTDSSLSSASDDDSPSSFLPSESLTDRILALRDMIPPSTRHRITTSTTRLFSLLKSSTLYTGKGLYVLGTGGLMVLVPYMMAVIEEQQFVEMEREQKAREMGSEILSPGAGQGAGQVKGPGV